MRCIIREKVRAGWIASCSGDQWGASRGLRPRVPVLTSAVARGGARTGRRPGAAWKLMQCGHHVVPRRVVRSARYGNLNDRLIPRANPVYRRRAEMVALPGVSAGEEVVEVTWDVCHSGIGFASGGGSGRLLR